MIFYTDRFVPEGSAGCVRVFFIPIIFIRPEYKDDAGLLAHEEMHVRQAWRFILPPIHALVYALDDRYRLACEVEAYREQLKHYSDWRGGLFAKFMSRDYGLSISEADALQLLEQS